MVMDRLDRLCLWGMAWGTQQRQRVRAWWEDRVKGRTLKIPTEKPFRRWPKTTLHRTQWGMTVRARVRTPFGKRVLVQILLGGWIFVALMAVNVGGTVFLVPPLIINNEAVHVPMAFRFTFSRRHLEASASVMMGLSLLLPIALMRTIVVVVTPDKTRVRCGLIPRVYDTKTLRFAVTPHPYTELETQRATNLIKRDQLQGMTVVVERPKLYQQSHLLLLRNDNQERRLLAIYKRGDRLQARLAWTLQEIGRIQTQEHWQKFQETYA